ncbi:MAG: hypothetical protein J7501_03725 [Bdellovibrio sp.]|nr:hypothetical protein [Bdellovibrio sp.]
MRCFPELKDENLAFKVDLNQLKELADEKFVTAHSQLRQRKVNYEDADKQEMNLILRTSGKKTTELSLQQVGDKGVLTDLALTKNQRINPKQEIINTFLLNATVKNDEYSYIDTKLNGIVSTYKRNFKVIVEYDLEDRARKRSISCENQKDLGIICTCSKRALVK